MPIHIVGKHNPECPLCDKPFQKVHFRDRDFYICRLDNVSILVNDPMVGHWNDHKDLENNLEIPCIVCKNRMNMFCRTDGYMKAVCPRCKASISTEEIADGRYYSKPGKDPNDPLKEGK